MAALLLLGPVGAFAQVGGNAPGVRSSGSSRFAGSMVALRPMVSALALDKSAQPTWNPYVGAQLMVIPRVRVSAPLAISAMLLINRELTHSDSTTLAGETTLSDTFITANYRLMADQRSGLGLSASAQLRLPSSTVSQGRTMVAGALGGLTLSWSGGFELLGARQGISLVGISRIGHFFHRHAEAGLQTPWLSECGALPTGCARFSHSGARNIAWRAQFIGVLGWRFAKGLSFSAQLGSFLDMLHPVTPAKVQGVTVAPDPTDPGTRGIAFYILSVSWQPTSALALALGTETANAHLQPDSTFRAPFFNRATTFFLSLRVFPAALL